MHHAVTRAPQGISVSPLLPQPEGYVPHMCMHPASLTPCMSTDRPDKHRGVCTIVIGDTAHRIIAKAVLSITGPDIQDVSGCQQLCGGQISVIEGAIHAARSAFESEDSKAALLADATNAFTTLNRQTALHNIRRFCPPAATILINTYKAPTHELFVDGSTILLQKGITQGETLAMAMYGPATIPLITRLDGPCKQIWYADDSAAFGIIEQLRDWWGKLTSEGPCFRYFANPSKPGL